MRSANSRSTGISELTISTSTSPASKDSPSFFFHAPTPPSVMVGERAGMVIWVVWNRTAVRVRAGCGQLWNRAKAKDRTSVRHGGAPANQTGDAAEKQALTDGADPRRASEEKRRPHLVWIDSLQTLGSERTIDSVQRIAEVQRRRCLVRYGGGADANDIWRAVPSRQYRRLGECQWGKRSGAIRSHHVNGLQVRSAQTSGN